MMWPGYGWGFGGLSWIMEILGIVVLGLIVWGIVMLARRGSQGGNSPGPSPTESALDVLKRRYANGEIGKEEFERIRKDLL